MTKRSILDLVGSEEGLQLLRKAVAEAAKRNREAGVTTATVIDGRTVITPGRIDSAENEQSHRSPPRVQARASDTHIAPDLT